MKKLFSIILIIWLLPFSTIAQPTPVNEWQSNDKAQLQVDFNALMEAVRSKNVDKSMAAIPERIWQFWAEQDKKNINTFKADMRSFMEDTYKNVSSLSGEFSLEDISYGVTEKGQKYAIIRYKTNVVLHSGQKEAIDSIVAAVKIDDKQYFLDIGKADNLILLVLLYPQFDGIDPSIE